MKTPTVAKPTCKPMTMYRKEHPARDEVIVLAPRRLLHDVPVRRVEAEGRDRQALGHQVDPQQLHRHEALGQPRAAVKKIEATSPRFEEIRYRIKAFMLL